MTARHVASLSSSLLERGSRDQSQGFVLNGALSSAAKGSGPVGPTKRDKVASTASGSSDAVQTVLEQQIRRVVREYLGVDRSDAGQEVGNSATAVAGRSDSDRLDQPAGASIDVLVESVVRHYSKTDPQQGSTPMPSAEGDNREAADRDSGDRRSGLAEPGDVGRSQRSPGDTGRSDDSAVGESESTDDETDSPEDSFAALTSRVEGMIQHYLECDLPTEADHRQADAKPENDQDGQDLACGSGAGEARGAVPAAQRDDQETDSDAQQVVVALRQGKWPAAEEIFGHLCGLTKPEVEQLFYRSKGEDLAAACRLIEADQLQFVSIFVMTRKAASAANSVDLVNLKQTIEFFDGLSKGHAERLQVAWRNRIVS